MSTGVSCVLLVGQARSCQFKLCMIMFGLIVPAAVHFWVWLVVGVSEVYQSAPGGVVGLPCMHHKACCRPLLQQVVSLHAWALCCQWMMPLALERSVNVCVSLRYSVVHCSLEAVHVIGWARRVLLYGTGSNFCCAHNDPAKTLCIGHRI